MPPCTSQFWSAQTSNSPNRLFGEPIHRSDTGNPRRRSPGTGRRGAYKRPVRHCLRSPRMIRNPIQKRNKKFVRRFGPVSITVVRSAPINTSVSLCIEWKLIVGRLAQCRQYLLVLSRTVAVLHDETLSTLLLVRSSSFLGFLSTVRGLMRFIGISLISRFWVSFRVPWNPVGVKTSWTRVF